MVRAIRPSHQSGCLRLVGLTPTGSLACCTPWSVFQDGRNGSLPPASRGRSFSRTRTHSRRSERPCPPRAAGRQGRRIERRTCPAPPLDADQRPELAAGRQADVCPGTPAASVPFPLNNFKYFLTLFSKFFSSFPHGTCSLSVSRQYLALDGIYHRLWAAFPSNPTLRRRLVEWLTAACRRGSHPLRRSLPGDLGTARHRGRLYRLQFDGRRHVDFHVGLFPLRSPLLGESWLVSFPPPTDMLKLSGWSCLNS